MRIEKHGNKFVVARGRKQVTYFCFYVGAYSSSWSKDIRNALTYDSLGHVAHPLGNLKQRARLRKEAQIEQELTATNRTLVGLSLM